MAELVQLHLENSLPELQQLEMIGLFSEEEIRKIIQTRKDLLYKLQKRKKKKTDFVNYIEYELNLLSLVKVRRKRLNCFFKIKDIDHCIAKRVDKLFKAAINRFPGDEDLRLDQISFCRRMKWNHKISGLYTTLLQVHSLNPALWIKAAKWEMEENNSAENARRILQRALRFLPESELLWREYFRMELMYMDLILKRKERLGALHMEEQADESDAVLNGSIAILVYNKATKEIYDVNFSLSFIEICQDFEFTTRILDYIFNDILECHPDDAETYDAIAKRPLLTLKEEINQARVKGVKIKTVKQKVMQKICSNYEKFLKTLKTEKMWSFYIDFLVSELRYSKREKRKEALNVRLLDVLSRAFAKDCLSEVNLAMLLDLLVDSDREEEALAISLTIARKVCNIPLWLRCLHLHIDDGRHESEILQVFNEAIEHLQEKDTFPIWKLGIEYAFANSKLLDNLFSNGILLCREVSVPLKEMYLEYAALSAGIKRARELYKKLKKHPVSPEFFKKMIYIENTEFEPSMKRLRKYFEDALNEYGTTDIDLWLDYIKNENENGNPHAYSMLCWRAKKALVPEQVDEFLARIALYSTGQ